MNKEQYETIRTLPRLAHTQVILRRLRATTDGENFVDDIIETSLKTGRCESYILADIIKKVYPHSRRTSCGKIRTDKKELIAFVEPKKVRRKKKVTKPVEVDGKE